MLNGCSDNQRPYSCAPGLEGWGTSCKTCACPQYKASAILEWPGWWFQLILYESVGLSNINHQVTFENDTSLKPPGSCGSILPHRRGGSLDPQRAESSRPFDLKARPSLLQAALEVMWRRWPLWQRPPWRSSCESNLRVTRASNWWFILHILLLCILEVNPVF